MCAADEQQQHLVIFLSLSFGFVFFKLFLQVAGFVLLSPSLLVQLLLMLRWSTGCFSFLLVRLLPMDLSYSSNPLHHLKHITLLQNLLQNT